MYKSAKFIKTAVHSKDFPVLRSLKGELLPEIAVAGRSNVGKSSLINHFLRTKGLAKTSATPGKTQAINFFTADDQLGVIDLPGYGYAAVPLEVRKHWGPMVKGYLETRPMLKALLLLFDIRRTPNEEDKQLLDWARYYQKAIILVLTKVDKVNKSELKLQTRKILDVFGDIQYVHYSSTKNIGGMALYHHVKGVLIDTL